MKGAYQDKETGRMVCQPIPLAGYKSIEIKMSKEGKATGYWKGITTSNSQGYTFTVGMESSKEDTSKDEQTKSLKTSLETGWEVSGGLEASFGGLGAGLSSSAHSTSTEEKSQEDTVSREITDTVGENRSTEHSTTCGSGAAGEMTGLWQWVISNQDGSVNAFTPHTVCRTGDKAFKAPECQFWDCANADCSKCKASS